MENDSMENQIDKVKQTPIGEVEMVEELENNNKNLIL